MNPFAHLGLSFPSRSSRSSLIPSQFRNFITWQLIFRTKRVCFTTRIFVLQSKTFPFKNCIGSAFNVKGIMECPNCREIENGEWRYYVSRSPDHELDLSEDEMDYEDSPIEMIIMDENGKQFQMQERTNGCLLFQIDHRRGQCLEGGSDNLKAQLAAQGEHMRA
ncbi:unnamed protein product [Malus baccata var. baccata]